MFRRTGIVSIADVAKATEISKTTIKKIVDYYFARNIIVSVGKGESSDGGGKKPELFRFNEDFGFIISIHLTPDSLYSAISNMRGDLHELHQFPIQHNAKMELILDYIAKIIRDYLDSIEVRGKEFVGLAIAMPGMVDPVRGVSIYSPHYHAWENDYPFKDELLKRINLDTEIFMDCTNRFQAFGEREKGIARGKDNFIIVDAIEEGLGAGIIVKGTMKRGFQNLSGEIGHMILSYESGVECICGAKGCFEALVSTKRILKKVKEGFSNNSDSLIFQNRAPDSVNMDHIFTALKKDDEFALELIDDVIHWFAVGLLNIIVIYDPQMIIIQGIYTNAGDYFLEQLRKKIKEYSLPEVNKKAEIEYSRLGWERGVLGGAAFVSWNYFEQEHVYRSKLARKEVV